MLNRYNISRKHEHLLDRRGECVGTKFGFCVLGQQLGNGGITLAILVGGGSKAHIICL